MLDLMDDNSIHFEEDFIFRSYRTVTSSPDISIAELVSNSWDAGALNVEITIPDGIGGMLEIEDDGSGMTAEEFHQRWMTLNYNRQKRQSNIVDVVENNEVLKRITYGRNGVGRHGMFCFSNMFTVETWKNKMCNRFEIATSSGRSPFRVISHEHFFKEGHGTKLSTSVTRNLANPEEMRNVISARFLYDPKFRVSINGECLELSEHKGVFEEKEVTLKNGIVLKITIIDSTKGAKKSIRHGIAFWVGGRLVGKPSWSYGDHQFLDGRYKAAKRYTIVVQTDDLFDEILPDWTGFINSLKMNSVYSELKNHVNEFITRTMSEQIDDLQSSVIDDTRDQLEGLSISGKRDISSFIETITLKIPVISQEILKVAVEAVINIEKARHGEQLLIQLSKMTAEDIDKLANMLDNWDINDVLAVLNEIDKRLTVIEAIKRIHEDKNTDELHTLHPLVLNARWLFGAEFDSPMFLSNVTLNTVIKSLFDANDLDVSYLNNPRKRPDIVVLYQSSIKAVCTDRIDNVGGGIMKPDQVLIIELKRGGFQIGAKEIMQAENYMRQIKKSSVLHKDANVRTFVVGCSIGDVDCHRTVDSGVIDVITYGHLIETASQKLFRLKDHLQQHYNNYGDESIVEKALKDDIQTKMKMN